ncbi:MAG TPA: hypothetical protein VIM69_10680 [Opitutaceae bacterium]
MSVTNTGSVVAHNGNGVTTSFPFSFPVLPQDKALLNVYTQDSTTFVTVKTLAQNEFTATFEEAGNGTVVYNPVSGPVPAGQRLVIERQVPYIQELELSQYSPYSGVAIMEALDKQEMQIQQIVDELDRAVLVPFGQDADEFGELVAAAAGYAEDAAASAEEAEGYKNQAAQYLADAGELAVLVEQVLPTTQTFDGDGTTLTFDLGDPTITEEAIDIYISGVYQQKGSYTVVDGVINFSQAPPNGTDNIEVKAAGSMAVLVPPAGSSFIVTVGALPASGTEGNVVYLTTDNLLYTYDGTTWSSVGTGEGGGGGIPTFGYIEPVASLPDTDNFTGRAVYNLTDSKIYLYVGGDWTAPENGSGGGGGTPELPDDASYYYIYPELPTEGLFVGQIAYQELDGKLYTWDGTEWQPLVTASDVNFPDGFTGVQIVTTLPASDNFEGRIVYLNTDGKLYRYTASGWTRETAAADLTGQIISTQISDGAVSTPKLAAGSVVASKIAANAVTSDAILAGAILTAKLAAGAVTANEIATGAVTADKVQAGAITAAKMNVTSLAAISATLGAVNISSAVMGSLQVDTLNIAGNAVTVQAGAETAGGTSIGTTFAQMQTVTVSWGTSASVWVFCQFKASVADELEIDVRSGGSSLLSAVKSFAPKADAFSHYMDMFPSGAVSGAGLTFWLRRTSAGSTTINARKMLVLAAKR